jgi:hypothetical protein
MDFPKTNRDVKFDQGGGITSFRIYVWGSLTRATVLQFFLGSYGYQLDSTHRVYMLKTLSQETVVFNADFVL